MILQKSYYQVTSENLIRKQHVHYIAQEKKDVYMSENVYARKL